MQPASAQSATAGAGGSDRPPTCASGPRAANTHAARHPGPFANARPSLVSDGTSGQRRPDAPRHCRRAVHAPTAKTLADHFPDAVHVGAASCRERVGQHLPFGHLRARIHRRRRRDHNRRLNPVMRGIAVRKQVVVGFFTPVAPPNNDLTRVAPFNNAPVRRITLVPVAGVQRDYLNWISALPNRHARTEVRRTMEAAGQFFLEHNPFVYKDPDPVPVNPARVPRANIHAHIGFIHGDMKVLKPPFVFVFLLLLSDPKPHHIRAVIVGVAFVLDLSHAGPKGVLAPP